MRDDLLDANGAVDWAETQIPDLQERFLSWQRRGPYKIVIEPDPDTGDKLMVAYERFPFDPLIAPQVGGIINSVRSALDLLASALACRNGIKPSAATHFPIFPSIQHFIDPLEGIEGKKWLSAPERATIKNIKPYYGGDELIWQLANLDNLRKHERLIKVSAIPATFFMTMYIPGMMREWRRLENKAILLRIPSSAARFIPTEANTNLTTKITFAEIGSRLNEAPVVEVLQSFAARVREIIAMFD